MIRPGPAQIEPSALPGGIISHVYAIPTNRLVAVFIDPAEVSTWDDSDALNPGENGICLVFYDGDTGERLVPPGYLPGDVLRKP